MENKNLNAARTPEERVREVSAHNAMKPIHIVTGFFDIGRANFDGYERDNETYFAYFRFWAHIQNDMTVYCASEHVARVAAIRAEYGLEDRTKIVQVDDPFNIEPELYRRMERAAADPGFQTSRFYRGPENDAPYSYITMLKAWCLSNTAERTRDDCMLAWVDFGINHCGVKYARSEDFDFLWEYPFPDKITAFCHHDPAEASLLDTLLFMTPVFDGSVVVMPRALCGAYWQAVRGAMDALVKLGCVDDDQMLSLIVYMDQPELFDIHLENGWYSGFELCSNQTFNLTEQEPPVFNEKIVRTMRRLADAPQHPFIRRMYEKTIRYYYPEAEKKD